jgi:hypothetical protein
MTIPQLPAGECALSLEYPAWPVLAFKVRITENEEATETVRLPHGRLIVESTPPGATILLGKRTLGQTPLTLDPIPAGAKKLTLQGKGFPPLEITVTVEDRGEAKVTPELGTGFSLLDPTALLRAIWVPDNPDKLSPHFDEIGSYAPQNGIVKNLNRKRLHENWLHKGYRYAGIIKAYDPKQGQVELVEEKNDLSKFRVLAKLSANAVNDKELEARLVKGASLAFFGTLSAVEEARWPARLISFEFASVEALQAGP